MPVSDRFQRRLNSGGYGYIMFEWIDKNQWHAFSLYENPLDKSVRHVFIANIGDWTKTLHQKIESFTETARPVWISGPFPSPYNNAINYDNMILVAAGIGITPALSAIEAFKQFRRVNLVWAVRDASMLVFFLENAKLDENGLNLIFYTGKDPLPEIIMNFNVHAHVKIIRERPNLSYVIPNIIEHFDKGVITQVNDMKKVRKIANAPPPNFKHFPNKSEHIPSRRSSEPMPSSSFHVTSKSSTPYFNEIPRASHHSIWKTTEKNDSKKESTTPEVWKEKPDTKEYVKSMPEDRFETWGMTYCGGRSRLLEALVKEKKRYGLPLQEEVFDW